MIYKTNENVPCSHITKNKQRLRQYGENIYLNNQDEFQIELFNPTQNKVLAQIELNGKSIGNGIVLRPGERVYLERYMDEARKFLFETYVVNGKNEEAKKAIALNGDVIVKFYNEQPPVVQIKPYPLYFQENYNFPSMPINAQPGGYVKPSTTNAPMIFGPASFSDGVYDTPNTSYYSSTVTGNIGNSATYTCSASLNLPKNFPGDVKRKRSASKEIETGRVEKGSYSNQAFTYDSTSFNSYATWSNSWKILPMSQKVMEREDLKVFCGNCGAKRKKDSYKFCPNCGNKY